MLTPTAQASLDQMVLRSLRSSPLMPAGGQRAVRCGVGLEEIATSQMVVLTVSSYDFRLSYFIHYTADQRTRQHFAARGGVQESEFDEQAFIDAIRECGNICCGNLNRELVFHFPHVGMSTPNIIDRRCMAYVDQLGTSYLRHFGLLDADGPPFAVTVCVNAFSRLDFSGLQAEDADATGELEMF